MSRTASAFSFSPTLCTGARPATISQKMRTPMIRYSIIFLLAGSKSWLRIGSQEDAPAVLHHRAPPGGGLVSSLLTATQPVWGQGHDDPHGNPTRQRSIASRPSMPQLQDPS